MKNAGTEAWRQVRRFMLLLRHKILYWGDDIIKVYYVQRFPLGECIIAAVIPIRRISIDLLLTVCWAHCRYRYLPRIINGPGARCLRLAYRFPKIESNEQERLLKYSRMIAERMEDIFGIPAIVSPIGGLVCARLKLRIPA